MEAASDVLWQPDGDPEALEIAINTIDRLVSEGGIHQLVEAAEAAVAANAIKAFCRAQISDDICTLCEEVPAI